MKPEEGGCISELCVKRSGKGSVSDRDKGKEAAGEGKEINSCCNVWGTHPVGLSLIHTVCKCLCVSRFLVLYETNYVIRDEGSGYDISWETGGWDGTVFMLRLHKIRTL